MDTTPLAGIVEALAKKIDREPSTPRSSRSAASSPRSSPARTATRSTSRRPSPRSRTLLASRKDGAETTDIVPVMAVTAPALTTAQAEAAAPLMVKISEWQTYFPISEKNGFGANIWIPALEIDGYVVGPARDVRLLGRHRSGHPRARLSRRRGDHQRPDRATGRPRRRDLLVLDDAVQRGAPRRASRWAPGATTTTTSTATRSASTPPCSSARRARSRPCPGRTTRTTRS